LKKYKLSIFLASTVLGGVGAIYLSAETNHASAAEVKTEVVAPANTNENSGTPNTGATNTQSVAPKEVENIGEVQGESHQSPLVGHEVIINNVVVTKTDKTGFYVQDKVSDNNPKTSDAIYVKSEDKVEKGELLKIQGTVKEGYMEEYAVKPGQTFKAPIGSLTVTQIVNATITKLGVGTLPDPVDISEKMPKDIVDKTPTKYDPENEALDYFESLEGMLVKVNKPKVLGPQYKGDIYVLPGNYRGQKLNNIEYGKEYLLNSSINVTGEKPDKLIIDSIPYPVKSWKGLLEKLCIELYNLDSDIFKELIYNPNFQTKERVILSNSISKLRQPIEISNDLYIESNLNANAILSYADIIAANFELSDEIYFVLKRKW